jgi:hypothetical protein
MALTDRAVRKAPPAEKPYKKTDGGGLYLLVNPNGSKWWRFDYRFAGKRKTLSMGTYPDTGLAAVLGSCMYISFLTPRAIGL